MPTSPLAGVDHIGILVRDINASLSYFTDVLGLPVVAEDVNQTAAVRLLYLDAGNVVIQLVSPIGPGVMAEALERQGEGLHHLCFQVEKISDALQSLAPVAGVNVSKGGRNRLTCFLPDEPNGLIMELTEIAESDE